MTIQERIAINGILFSLGTIVMVILIGIQSIFTDDRAEVYAAIECDSHNQTIMYTGLAYQDQAWDDLKQRLIRLYYDKKKHEWEVQEYHEFFKNWEWEDAHKAYAAQSYNILNDSYGCLVA